MKRVRVLDENGQEYVYPLDQSVAEVTIGRSQRNDIILGSKTVSRRHAILKVMRDRVMVINQSPNGVLIGGERVERAREVRFGEFFTIDTYRISVEAQGQQNRRGPSSGPSRSGPRKRGPGRGSSDGGRNGGQQRFNTSGPSISKKSKRSGESSRGPKVKRSEDLSPREEAEAFKSFVEDMIPPDYEEPRINLAGEDAQIIDRKKRHRLVEFKKHIHEELKERLDLHSFQIKDYRTPRTVRQVSGKLRELLEFYAHEVPPPYTREDVFKELMDEVCGLGPIEDLIKHKGVTEIMVVDRDHIYAELDGSLALTDRFFNDEKSMMTVIERIVIPRGRRIDETTPLVDTRLADGSRVNAVIPPLALKDPCLTIRKFPEERLDMLDLIRFGSVTPDIGKFLGRAVRARKNVVISGGTGSGKTTLLNIMSGFIGLQERIVTIEDAAELQLQQEHVVSLETKPPNLEGKGEVSIRDLVKNALRMRPDRVVVGECRGGEALDMLQAMNTGHDGSMTTVHSNSPIEAISRLETLVMYSGMELPSRAIREQIANSVDVIVQQTRYMDGSRRVSYVSEVVGIDDDGFVHIEDIYRFKQTGIDADGKVTGYHHATGYLPSFLNEFIVKGLASQEDFF